MTDFSQLALSDRLGEASMLTIIDQWERRAGVQQDNTLPLQIRWQIMMNSRQSYDA